MYKQNRKVMSAEYGGGSGDNSRVESHKTRHKSSRHERFSTASGSFSLTSTSAASDKSKDETFLRTISRRFMLFIFSQVGVGSLVVSYTIFGAFIFQALETSHDIDNIFLTKSLQVDDRRRKAVEQLWNNTIEYNTLNAG